MNCTKNISLTLVFVFEPRIGGTFVNIFKFTHSCVTCSFALICMWARTCSHSAPVIYDLDAFNTLLMIFISDKHRKFVFAGGKFPNFAFMRNGLFFLSRGNLVGSFLVSGCLWKYLKTSELMQKWFIFVCTARTWNNPLQLQQTFCGNENVKFPANDYYYAIFCSLSDPVEH